MKYTIIRVRPDNELGHTVTSTYEYAGSAMGALADFANNTPNGGLIRDNERFLVMGERLASAHFPGGIYAVTREKVTSWGKAVVHS